MDRSPQTEYPSSRLSTLVIAATAGVALLTLAAWTLAPRASRASGPGGPHLSIAVVPPVEPLPVAGEVMEVGLLSDGFDRAALERQAEVASPYDLPGDAYVGEDWTSPTLAEQNPRRAQPPSSNVAMITSTDPLADGSRLFGFDQPAPPSTATAPQAEAPGSQPEPAKTSQSFFQ